MPKEVKQWITVKGRRVPIFEGETKESTIKKMKAGISLFNGKKTTYQKGEKKQEKKLPEGIKSKRRADGKGEKKSDKAVTKEEAIDKIAKQQHVSKKTAEEIYKQYSSKQRKEFENEKDEDTKAKQIARNKKEADERNNKSSDTVNRKNLISNSTWKPGYYKDDGGDMYEISYEKRGNKIYQLSNGKGFDGSYIEIKSGKYDAYDSNGDFVLSTTSAAKATKAAWKTPKSEKLRLATKSEIAKERKEQKEASKYWENKHKEDKARYRNELGSTIKSANAKLQNMNIEQLRKLAKRLEPNVETYTRYNESKNSKKTLIEYIIKDYKFYYK